jgi:hypothetical protein
MRTLRKSLERTGSASFRNGTEFEFQNFSTGRLGWLPKYLMLYIDPRQWGHVAEWLRNGLQIRCRSAWYPRATRVSRSEISPRLFLGSWSVSAPFDPLASKQSWITEYFGIQKPLVLLGFLHRRVGDPSRIRNCNPRSRKPFVISHFPPINQKLTPSTQSARGFFRDIVRGFSKARNV